MKKLYGRYGLSDKELDLFWDKLQAVPQGQEVPTFAIAEEVAKETNSTISHADAAYRIMFGFWSNDHRRPDGAKVQKQDEKFVWVE